jgi:hypothetical protein
VTAATDIGAKLRVAVFDDDSAEITIVAPDGATMIVTISADRWAALLAFGMARYRARRTA